VRTLIPIITLIHCVWQVTRSVILQTDGRMNKKRVDSITFFVFITEFYCFGNLLNPCRDSFSWFREPSSCWQTQTAVGRAPSLSQSVPASPLGSPQLVGREGALGQFVCHTAHSIHLSLNRGWKMYREKKENENYLPDLNDICQAVGILTLQGSRDTGFLGFAHRLEF
jgi:hypothetical protein